MANGDHFTLADLIALEAVENRNHPSERWGQAICNRYRMTNPRLFYGNDANTRTWIETAARDYHL